MDAGRSIEKVGVAKNVGEELLGALTDEDGWEAAGGGFGLGFYTLGLGIQKSETA